MTAPMLLAGPSNGVVRKWEITAFAGHTIIGEEQTISAPASIGSISSFAANPLRGEVHEWLVSTLNTDGDTALAYAESVRSSPTWVDVPFQTRMVRALDYGAVQGSGPMASGANYEVYVGCINEGTDTTLDVAYRARTGGGGWSTASVTVGGGTPILWVGGVSAFPGTDYFMVAYGIGAEYSWGPGYTLDQAIASSLRIICFHVSSSGVSSGSEVVVDTAARIGIHSPTGNAQAGATSSLACLLWYNSASPFDRYTLAAPVTRSGTTLSVGAATDVSPHQLDYSGAYENAIRHDDTTVVVTQVLNNNDSHSSWVLVLKHDGTAWNRVSSQSFTNSDDDLGVAGPARLSDNTYLIAWSKNVDAKLTRWKVSDSGVLSQIGGNMSIPGLTSNPPLMKCVGGDVEKEVKYLRMNRRADASRSSGRHDPSVQASIRNPGGGVFV